MQCHCVPTVQQTHFFSNPWKIGISISFKTIAVFALIVQSYCACTHVLSGFGHSLIFHLLCPHGVLCFNIHPIHLSLRLSHCPSTLLWFAFCTAVCFVFACCSSGHTRQVLTFCQNLTGEKKRQFRSEAGFHLHTGLLITRLQTRRLETTPGILHRNKATRRSGGTETGRKNGFCLVQCFHINRRSMVLYVLCNTTSPLKKEITEHRVVVGKCFQTSLFSEMSFSATNQTSASTEQLS